MDEIGKVLDYLTKISKEVSYEKICEMSSEQQKEYRELFVTFQDSNQLKLSNEKEDTRKKGKALEDLVTFLITISGGVFKVVQNIRTNSNEIDQVVELTEKGKMLLTSGIIDKKFESFLGECKNYNRKVNVTYIGKFCSLLLTTQYQLGILFSYYGVTGSNWKDGNGLIRKFYLHKENKSERFCIIDFNVEDFKSVLEGNNFLQIIENKIKTLQLDTEYFGYLKNHPAESTIRAKSK